jgi:hypothetical protein
MVSRGEWIDLGVCVNVLTWNVGEIDPPSIDDLIKVLDKSINRTYNPDLIFIGLQVLILFFFFFLMVYLFVYFRKWIWGSYR